MDSFKNLLYAVCLFNKPFVVPIKVKVLFSITYFPF